MLDGDGDLMSLRKQPLVHVFPGEEAPLKPAPPPNRIIRDSPDLVIVALFVLAVLASAAIVLMAAAVGN